MPADIAPSPITQTTLLSRPIISRATAMPRPAEIEVDERAAPNGSYSLSARLVTPESRPPCLVVRLRRRRLPGFLCGELWWPTSQIKRSRGVSKTWCNATVSSTTPRPAPKCPPVLDTALMRSCRNSSAISRSRSGSNRRRSSGVRIWLRSGVLDGSYKGFLPADAQELVTAHSQGGDEARDTRRDTAALKPPSEKKQFT